MKVINYKYVSGALADYCKGGRLLNIVNNPVACYGCGICELACSFHHQKVFSPALSSIKVLKNNRTGKVKWSIDTTCDSCKGQEQPLCIKYCVYGALKGAS
jgi:anaerobic carbon-monoxide dehydrogenase iron sulfur subunit